MAFKSKSIAVFPKPNYNQKAQLKETTIRLEDRLQLLTQKALVNTLCSAKDTPWHAYQEKNLCSWKQQTLVNFNSDSSNAETLSTFPRMTEWWVQKNWLKDTVFTCSNI